MSKHAAKLNYRNIILTAVMVVLVIAVIILLVSLSSTQKQPEPFQSSSEESSSSAEKSSSESRPTLSSSAASSHSKISMIPDEPYKVDTTGKIVRNAFDENGEIDLLFPINTTYYVTRNFSVKHTEEIGDGKIMDARAAPHCREMLAAMRKEINSEITPFSALRTFKYQEGNFSRKMNKYLNKGYSEEDAFNTAATIVAIPGTSEHQLGLAVDIYLWDLWNREIGRAHV